MVRFTYQGWKVRRKWIYRYVNLHFSGRNNETLRLDLNLSIIFKLTTWSHVLSSRVCSTDFAVKAIVRTLFYPDFIYVPFLVHSFLTTNAVHCDTHGPICAMFPNFSSFSFRSQTIIKQLHLLLLFAGSDITWRCFPWKSFHWKIISQKLKKKFS